MERKYAHRKISNDLAACGVKLDKTELSFSVSAIDCPKCIKDLAVVARLQAVSVNKGKKEEKK